MELIRPMEFLKPINDFTGYYISDDGNAYCDLGKGCRNKSNRVPIYKLNPRVTRNGYLRIYARRDSTGEREDLYIHRLVAEAFISNPLNKPIVNHINTLRNKNNVENLEWSTSKENNEYTFEIGHVHRDSKGRYSSNNQIV